MRIVIALSVLYAGSLCSASLFQPDESRRYGENEVVSRATAALKERNLKDLGTWLDRTGGGASSRAIAKSINASVDVDVRKAAFVEALKSNIGVAQLISANGLLDDITLYGILKDWEVPSHLKSITSEHPAFSAIRHLASRRDGVAADLNMIIKSIRTKNVEKFNTTIASLPYQYPYYLERAMAVISTEEATAFLGAINTQCLDPEPGSSPTYIDGNGKTKKRMKCFQFEYLKQLLEHKLKGESGIEGHQEPLGVPLQSLSPKSVPPVKSDFVSPPKSSVSSAPLLMYQEPEGIDPLFHGMIQVLNTGDFNALVISYLQLTLEKRDQFLAIVKQALLPQRRPQVLARLNEHMHVLGQVQHALA